MASKAKEVAVKENEKEKDEAPPIGTAETTDILLPLLDLSDAAVKRARAATRNRIHEIQILSVCPGTPCFCPRWPERIGDEG